MRADFPQSRPESNVKSTTMINNFFFGESDFLELIFLLSQNFTVASFYRIYLFSLAQFRSKRTYRRRINFSKPPATL